MEQEMKQREIIMKKVPTEFYYQTNLIKLIKEAEKFIYLYVVL